MPPWSFPDGYCHQLDAGMSSWNKHPITLDADYAFCLSWSKSLWFGFLFVGLAAWVFFTLLSLLGSFEWRDLAGFLTSEVLRRLSRQVGYLLTAMFSFFLLLVAHQLVYLVLSLFLHDQEVAGNGPSWHTDLLWNHSYLGALADARKAIDHDISHGGFSNPNGGNDFPAPFGLTWDQVRGILDTLIGFVPEVVVGVRFATLFIALVTAPLAIICKSNPLTSPLFDLWLRYWLQLEGIALGSIAVLAGYRSLDLSGLSATNADYIRLGLLGLVTTANLAFVSSVLGNFLRDGAQFYASQQQRGNADQHGWLGVIGLAAGGLIAAAVTIPTGGVGLPAGLAIGGAVTSAIVGGGGAALTAVQAQNTPGAQVGPGPSISAGISRAAGSIFGAVGDLAEGEPGGGGPPTSGQDLQALGGAISQSLPPGSALSLPAYDASSGMQTGSVPTRQAIVSYLAAGGQAGAIQWTPAAQSQATAQGTILGAVQGTALGSSAPPLPSPSSSAPPLPLMPPALPPQPTSAPYIQVGSRMVPTAAIERQLQRAPPFVQDALRLHSQYRLSPQALPGVVAAVESYYRASGGFRTGRFPGTHAYSSTRVQQAASRAVQMGRFGLASRDVTERRVIRALRNLQ